MLYERADDAIKRVDADESIDAVDHQCYTSVQMRALMLSSVSMRMGGGGYMQTRARRYEAAMQHRRDRPSMLYERVIFKTDSIDVN